jgi:hypothetical protein
MSVGFRIDTVADILSSVNPDRPHTSGEGETAVLDGRSRDRETGEDGRSGTGRAAEKTEKEEERGLRT